MYLDPGQIAHQTPLHSILHTVICKPSHIAGLGTTLAGRTLIDPSQPATKRSAADRSQRRHTEPGLSVFVSRFISPVFLYPGGGD